MSQLLPLAHQDDTPPVIDWGPTERHRAATDADAATAVPGRLSNKGAQVLGKVRGPGLSFAITGEPELKVLGCGVCVLGGQWGMLARKELKNACEKTLLLQAECKRVSILGLPVGGWRKC